MGNKHQNANLIVAVNKSSASINQVHSIRVRVYSIACTFKKHVVMLYENKRHSHPRLGGQCRKETVKDEGFYDVLTFATSDVEGVKI